LATAPTVRLTLRQLPDELDFSPFPARPRLLDQAHIERIFKAVVLVHVQARHRRHLRLVEQAVEVQAAGLPVFDACISRPSTDLSSNLAMPVAPSIWRLLKHKEEAVDDTCLCLLLLNFWRSTGLAATPTG
jgi:hypothetical protein